MQDAYRKVFASLRERPGQFFLTQDRYDVLVGFVIGCDLGNAGGLLRGFEEWLLQRHGGRRNVHWAGLVLDAAFPDREDRLLVAEMTEDEHRHAISVLWELLDRFLSESGGLLETRKIYRGYWNWQNAQGMTPEL